VIDLRSDTVTRPTPAMRRAMAEAEVGDDVYGEDPTVNRLQEYAASLMGKEAALFVPTGTMGNQVAIAVHARPGSEVLCEARAHIVEYELASMAVISGCMPRAVVTSDGLLTAEAVDRVLRPENISVARPGVIVLENTSNLWSGAVTPLEEVESMGRFARERSIPLHMDGARIFHAAAALGVPAGRLAAPCDSIMFCLSKGLCAPVGSMLAGSRAFVDEARRWRKRLGGGMRQAGVLAAAGLVALQTMRDRLPEDHDKARVLAEGLADLPGWRLEVPDPLTNIVYARLPGERGANRRFVEALTRRGVICNAVAGDRIRMVTHHDVTEADVRTAVAEAARAWADVA
jgi:threonine aldolase